MARTRPPKRVVSLDHRIGCAPPSIEAVCVAHCPLPTHRGVLPFQKVEQALANEREPGGLQAWQFAVGMAHQRVGLIDIVED